MKVALIVDTWFPFIGGGQINAWEISKRLAEKGITIDIITRNNGADKLKRVKNLYVYKLGSKSAANNSLSKILFIVRSFFFVYKRNYDLVHAHAFLPGITARLLMVFKGIPAVFTVHGTSINTNLNNFFSRWLERLILTKILYSAQITVSQDFLKIPNVNKKIFYISNGVDLQEFDKVRTVKSKQPTLIFVGRLHPQKNLRTLINAINLAKEKIPNLKLLIVGEGSSRKQLLEQVKRLKLEKNVKFHGEITGDDLVRFYKSSHLFILPSVYEGQPLTLLEAWAAKLPVLVSRTGDCQYLVKNKVNGYFLKRNDLKHIRESIEIVFKNLRKLRKLGLSGYNTVKGFTWEQSAIKTLEVYKMRIRN